MAQITLTQTNGDTRTLALSTVERIRALSDGFIIYDTSGGKILTAPYAAFATTPSTQAVADTLRQQAGIALTAVPMRQYNLTTGKVINTGTDFISPAAIDYIETMLPAKQLQNDPANAYIGLRLSLRVGEWVDTLLTPQEAQSLIDTCRKATALLAFAPYQATGDTHLMMEAFSKAGMLYLNPAHISAITTPSASGCALTFHGNRNNTLELTVRQGSPRQFANDLMHTTQGLAPVQGVTPAIALRLSDYVASHVIDGEHNGQFLLRLERPTTPANPYERYLQLAFTTATQRQQVAETIATARKDTPNQPKPPAQGL